MISVRGFISHLPFQYETIAGDEGSMGNLCQDISLLSERQVWLHEPRIREWENVLVCVQTEIFPAYSSTFDLLLRFFQQAGAAGIVIQGGQRTDFPMSTLILADKLRVPLILIDSSVRFSVLTGYFYRLLTEQAQQTKAYLQGVRRRLENIHLSTSSLSAWMDAIERELSVRAVLRIMEGVRPELRARWVGNQKSQQRRRLVIPVQGLHALYELELDPTERSALVHQDAEGSWIEELSGILSVQGTYFLIAELPGTAYQSEWATSLESLLYYRLSRLSFFQPIHQGYAVDSLISADYNGKPAQFVEMDGGLSTQRRMTLIQPKPVSAATFLWVKSVSGNIKLTQAIGDAPNAYKVYSPQTLLMRQQVLALCSQTRIAKGTQPEMLACLPWRDWRGSEGVLIFWLSSAGHERSPSDEAVKELLAQLEARLQLSLRSYCCRQTIGRDASVEEIIQAAVRMTETSYEDFLKVAGQSKIVQFAENEADVANLMISNPLPDHSLDHALQLLSSLLTESNKPLLEALEAYLECGGKMQIAAEKLFLHRNTLRYRLKRAEEILRVNLDNDEVRFAYQLAIRTWRLHN